MSHTSLSTALAQPPVILRPYQAEAIDAIADSFLQEEHPIWRQLVAIPTAGGKTVVIASLLQSEKIQDWLHGFLSSQRKILMIAHREELLDQAVEKIQWVNPDLYVDVEQAERHAAPMAEVVVASVQTLAARGGRRMEGFDPEDFRIVIIDECHHATAPSYLTVMKYFGFLPPDEFMPAEHSFPDKDAALEFQRIRLEEWDKRGPQGRLLVGITATPKRSDNIGLEAVFQDITFTRNIRDLIEAGFLSRIRAIHISSKTLLDGVHTRAGDFAVDELAQAINNEDRNKLAVKGYKEHADGRKALVFCADVAHSKSMAEEFNNAGINAEAVYGAMPGDERHEALNRYRNGKTTVLTNCQVLTEGTDLPDTSCIIHARPTQSNLLFVQMSGRGLRLSPGKKDCIIIDIVDLTRRHSIITAPTLLGLPAGFDVNGEDVLNAVKRIEKIQEDNPYIDIGKIKSLKELDIRSREIDLFAIDNELAALNAGLAWMRSGDTFRLSYPAGDWGNETITLAVDTLGKWHAQHEGPFEKKAIGEAQSDLTTAIAHAETWMNQNYPKSFRMMRRDAPWRQNPASSGQLNYLGRLGCPITPGMTSGEASALIDIYRRRPSTVPFRRTR